MNSSLCASRRLRLWTRLSSGGNSSPQTARPVAFSSAMVSWIISRLVVLVFGTLYPAYSSYKAVKTKDVREYVKWMMYWIIFALFTTVEVFTDMFLCW
ncbi:Receptor expression-enhancing protein 1 [Ameca splendens]|uniref:Receptor expression-enhancing protein n=1 Tax=Ameca splendens TaxID=208324 RepID=A0ABV0ZCU7_9TELE